MATTCCWLAFLFVCIYIRIPWVVKYQEFNNMYLANRILVLVYVLVILLQLILQREKQSLSCATHRYGYFGT